MKKILNIITAFFSFCIGCIGGTFRANHLEHFDLDTNVNRAISRAQNLEHFDSFENESLEDFEIESLETEFYEDMEHLRRRGHKNPRLQAERNLVNRRGKKGKQYLMTGGKKANTLVGGNAMITNSQASFTITVKRLSNNIALDLPVQIFNSIDSLSNALQTLKKYLPSSVTVTAAPQVNGSILFTFTSGLLVDTIEVGCNEVPYNKFIYATLTDTLRVSRTLYRISDETQQTQFGKSFKVVMASLFGLAKENPITVSNYIDPQNFRKDSVAIPQAYDVDKQTGIVMDIAYVAGAPLGYVFQIDLGMTVSIFIQHTKNNLG